MARCGCVVHLVCVRYGRREATGGGSGQHRCKEGGELKMGTWTYEWEALRGPAGSHHQDEQGDPGREGPRQSTLGRELVRSNTQHFEGVGEHPQVHIMLHWV